MDALNINGFENLPVNFQELLDDSPNRSINTSAVLQNMKHTENKCFIECGTNLTSSIWTDNAVATIETLREDYGSWSIGDDDRFSKIVGSGVNRKFLYEATDEGTNWMDASADYYYEFIPAYDLESQCVHCNNPSTCWCSSSLSQMIQEVDSENYCAAGFRPVSTSYGEYCNGVSQNDDGYYSDMGAVAHIYMQESMWSSERCIVELFSADNGHVRFRSDCVYEHRM